MGGIARRRCNLGAHRPIVRKGAALAGGLLLSLALAACAGGNSPAPLPSPSPTIGREDAGILPLERFHYVASLTLRSEIDGGEEREVTISTEGDFQSPNRNAFTYAIRSGAGAVERSAVVINEDAWFRSGTEPWREAPLDDPELADLLAVAFSPLRPRFLSGPAFEQVRQSVRRLPSTEEVANDVPADHYRVESSDGAFRDAFLADERLLESVQHLTSEIWLAADGGWPVRVVATGVITVNAFVIETLGLQAPTFWELRIDVSRPNDPRLTVAAPDGDG